MSIVHGNHQMANSAAGGVGFGAGKSNTFVTRRKPWSLVPQALQLGAAWFVQYSNFLLDTTETIPEGLPFAIIPIVTHNDLIPHHLYLVHGSFYYRLAFVLLDFVIRGCLSCMDIVYDYRDCDRTDIHNGSYSDQFGNNFAFSISAKYDSITRKLFKSYYNALRRWY